jgi:flavodoxin I
MNVLVIYDSVFGNTEKIAQAVGAAFGENVQVVNVQQAASVDLTTVDLLLVGSPTRAFKPTEGIVSYLKELPADQVKGLKAAAFDTRIPLESISNKFLRGMVKMGGYADKTIIKLLAKKGANIVANAGFMVLESEGPLADGELERAAEWARSIA